MRIFYAIRNHPEAEIQLKYFLQNCQFEVRTAGFSSCKRINFDYQLLNTKVFYLSKEWEKTEINLKKQFGSINEKLPKYCWNDYYIIISAWQEFKPDLIISDGHQLVSTLARLFKLPLWHVSSSAIIEGVKWNYLFWQNNAADLRNYRNQFRNFNIIGDRNFIISPFGHLSFPLELRNNFEWVTPYYLKSVTEFLDYDLAGIISDYGRHEVLTKIFNAALLNFKILTDFENCDKILSTKNFFSEADVFTLTSYLFSTQNPKALLLTQPKNIEYQTNALVMEKYSLGINLGLLEAHLYEAPDLLLQNLEKKFEPYQFFDLDKYPIKHLHTIIEEYHENKSRICLD